MIAREQLPVCSGNLYGDATFSTQNANLWQEKYLKSSCSLSRILKSLIRNILLLSKAASTAQKLFIHRLPKKNDRVVVAK